MPALLSLISVFWSILPGPILKRIVVYGALIALLNSLSFSIGHASHLKLRIGYNENSSYPHFLGSGALPTNPPGISVDIIQIIANQLLFDIEFVRMPGRRVLHELKANRLDAAFIFSFKPERQEFGVFPMIGDIPDSERRLAVLSYVLYTPRGSNLDWDGKSFKNLSGAIGANAGYSIVGDLRKKNVIIEEAKSTSNNFAKLKNGRVVGVADQEVVADAYLSKHDFTDIQKIPRPLATKDYFMIFSRKFSSEHPDIRDKIWQVIADKRDELTEQLIPKYLEDDFQASPIN